MEVELEPKVKPLGYKVKALSRESPAQKASHVLDTDLRNHWSTSTNTKEWILLELDDPCLLSHIRIYNKSVLEWEISVGLSYKPETFVKIRPRCEAPRRDMMYPMNYTPCRYVRISCMRGNPIAIFFIQLIGVTVIGLEPDFQPVVNYLLPNIISHKLDASDVHLQLLQDITSRLARFLPHIEIDLINFSEAGESSIRFLAMLAGPFFPIFQIANEREVARSGITVSDQEASKTNPSLTVSSNFEPRRSRNASSYLSTMSSHLVFRPDAIFTLLRKAYKDSTLGKLCKMVSRILIRLSESVNQRETFFVDSESISSVPVRNVPDYSKMFGEEFQMPDCNWDSTYLNLLDFEAVEEGILHVLYASVSQPLLCSKLADNISDFCLALPLIQAMLPALRPIISSSYQIDDSFSPWEQQYVQNALCQIVGTSSSMVYRPLLLACSGYLSSFLPSHAKAACVLIDLCSGVLAPCIAQIIAKIDLTMELLEDLLGVIQGARLSLPRARAALKYIVLALSGNMDDVIVDFKDSKHRLLFLLEMLEPFLDPALTPLKGIIAFGNVSSVFLENQEENCAIALNVIRTAIRKRNVLPSLEAEWRRGSVAPSVLLAVLDPQMQLPSDIDNRKFSASTMHGPHSLIDSPAASCNGVASSRLNNKESADGRADDNDISGKVDIPEDTSLLFAPSEFNGMYLNYVPANQEIKISDPSTLNSAEVKDAWQKTCHFSDDFTLATGQGLELYNFLTNYFQLLNYRDCESRASEFRCLALDLISQNEGTPEGHDVVIDSLLLAAECYINPCFVKSFKDISADLCKIYSRKTSKNQGLTDINRIFRPNHDDLKVVADLERKRDKIVLEILIEAAELDRKHQKVVPEGEMFPSQDKDAENVVNLCQDDILNSDAITLVRQNQELLWNFLIRRLHRNFNEEQYSVHEILMWCLLLLLHSATKLFCSPENVVDAILKFAENFQEDLNSFDHKYEGNSQLKKFKLHQVQCRWILLHKLVIASSGNEERPAFSLNSRNGLRVLNLIPPSAWLEKVPTFSPSALPLVRYFGWMAVSRNARQYLKDQIFLVSDLSQLTYLVSIFSDDLSLVDGILEQKGKIERIEGLCIHRDNNVKYGDTSLEYRDGMQSFHVLYPDISKLFPNLKKEFVAFGETILEAVGQQLKFLTSAILPDLMSWFSNLCSWPFVTSRENLDKFQQKSDYFKGFVAKNAKAVILYVLETIVVNHMEAMAPETPRMIQVLVSLCRTSYCDISFLDSVLCLLKPVIVYSLSKVSKEESLLIEGPQKNFESLCFGELFKDIEYRSDSEGAPKEVGKCQALTIFVLANIFGDLSFHWKTKLLQSSILWADFTCFGGAASFHDYIGAYHVLMENCKSQLIRISRMLGGMPFKVPPFSDTSFDNVDIFTKSSSWFLGDICYSISPTKDLENHQDHKDDVCSSQKSCQLNLEEIRSISMDIESLISVLCPTIEQCFKLHHKLANKLLITLAECFMYARYLSLIVEKVSSSSEVEKLLPHMFLDEIPNIWRTSLEGLSSLILELQKKLCWEVSSVLLDSLLGVPHFFSLDNVIGDICLAMKILSDSAPTITLRLQTDMMMSLLLRRSLHNLGQSEMHLSELFCSMLSHSEPEQRCIALKHLGQLVGQDVDGGKFLSSTPATSVSSSNLRSSSEPFIHALVSSTWDQVAWMSSSDSSLPLRTRATALLVNYIPYAERSKLQSFLAEADNVLQCLGTLGQPVSYGPLTRFSLALIASICLFSPAEDISLIPECIWRNIEDFGLPGNGRYCTNVEQKACEALCRLKEDGDQAKEHLKGVLSSSSPTQLPDFASTRESILQVVSNLTSNQSYFELFSKKVDQKTMELEEAELEMKLIQTECPVLDPSIDCQDWLQIPLFSTYAKDDHRLQQIKDEIESIEKSKLREDIVARRQSKLLLRRARQQFFEDAALRESELLQKFDREKTIEKEKEIERQTMLELERARTRELQHNLDIEKEKLTQRELQRELEQVETGLRSSRREFASSNHIRPRDRYREDTGREVIERASSLHETVISNVNQPTVVLSGSRSISSHLPTNLQARDRADDYGSSHEDNFDGKSKDSGDTGSIGEPDMLSLLEGQSMGFGSGQRLGSRSSKPRQIIERKERDTRREGKWERKH